MSESPTRDWHRVIAEFALPADDARRLADVGFVVVPGPPIPGGVAQLSAAYDRAVATADPSDVRVSSSTRVSDFVNRGPEFDGIYVHGPLLAACVAIIGAPFKLSGMLARTLEPGATMESLHADVKPRADGWPLVGFILMVDAFEPDNGATRFVPASHLLLRDPGEVITNLEDDHESQVLACGPAGSLLIFNASVWHGHTANRSTRRRRSIQGHFVPRGARAATDQAARMRPETFRRIGDLAKYVLDVAQDPKALEMTASLLRTPTLKLVPQTPEEIRARVAAMTAPERAELSADWLAQLRAAVATDPWVHGFAVVRHDGVVLGHCGYKGPPTDGAVEIAYGIAPDQQGKGYATEAAAALVAYAFDCADVSVVRAHTLPESSASQRVLAKCGFERVGNFVDPEDGLVWRFEKRG